MSVIKNKLKKDFSIIPNAIICDEDISIEARFMYIYLASKPDDWVVQHEDIKQIMRIKSRTSMAKYALELINSGWASRTLRKGEGGSFNGGYDYVLHHEKIDVIKPITPEIVRPKNEHTEVPKNGRTDVSKNGHDVCPNFATSQKMDTTNTEIDRQRDYRCTNTLNIWEIWQAVLVTNPHGLKESELLSLRNWAEFKAITDRYQIQSTINTVKRIKLSGGDIEACIDASIAGDYKGIANITPKSIQHPNTPKIIDKHDLKDYTSEFVK